MSMLSKDLSSLIELADLSNNNDLRLSLFEAADDQQFSTNLNISSPIVSRKCSTQQTESAAAFPKRCFFSKFQSTSRINFVYIHVQSDSSTAFAITADDDNSASIWDLETKLLVRRLTGLHSAKIHTLTASDNLVATASDDKKIGLWNFSTGDVILQMVGGHEWYVTSVAFYSLGPGTTPLLASCSFCRVGVIWDTKSGDQVFRLSGGHASGATSLTTYDFSGRHFRDKAFNCHVIATAGFDKIAVLWNAQTGKLIRKFEGGHSDFVSSIRIFFDTNAAELSPYSASVVPLLITGSFDKSAVIWNILTGEMIHKLDGGHSDWIISVDIHIPTPLSYNGSGTAGSRPLVLTAGHDGTAVIWDLNTGLKTRTFGSSSGGSSSISVAPLSNACFVPSNNSGHSDKYNGSNNILLQQSTGNSSIGENSNDLRVLTGGEDGFVTLYDLSAEHSRILEGHAAWVTSLKLFLVPAYVKSATEFSGKTLLLSGCSDGEAIVWDLLSGEAVRQLTGQHTASLFAIDVFVPHDTQNGVVVGNNKLAPADKLNNILDNVLIVTACFDKSVVVWDLISGSVVRKQNNVHADFISCLAIYNPVPVSNDTNTANTRTNNDSSANNKPVYFTGSFDKSFALWDLVSGTLIYRINNAHDNYIGAGAIYNSGNINTSMILTGSGDCTLKCWALSTGQWIKTLSGHNERIKAIALHIPSDGSNPLVISGSYDKSAIVWNLHTGEIVHRLSGIHTNWVTAVAVCESIDGNALVVTASFDASSVLWDLKTGKMIRNLECNHTDSIRSAAMFSRPDRSPLIITCSNDRTIAITDSLYPMNYMPPKSFIERQFLLDAREVGTKADWSRISALSCKYKESFWASSADLFLSAAQLRRSDFFILFQNMLAHVIMLVGTIPDSHTKSTSQINNTSNTNQANNNNNTTLLRYVIEQHDLDSLRIILKCWIVNINQPLRSNVVCSHASRHISKDELVLLSKEYPSEFKTFICALKLVSIENHREMSCVIENSSRAVVVGVSAAYVTEDLWAMLPSNSSKAVATTSVVKDKYCQYDIRNTTEIEAQPATLMYLPVQDASNISVLHAYVNVCKSLDSVDIFDSEVGIIALRYAWDSFGRKEHRKSVLKYLFMLFNFTVSMLSFHALMQRSVCFQIIAWLFQSLLLYGISYRVYVEVLKLRSLKSVHSTQAIWHFVTDIWNVVDMISLPCIFVGTIIRCVARDDTVYSKCFLAIGSVSLWFKSLYFLRPLPSSGPLVSMILQIGYDIRYFLIVLCTVLCGFAQGFWLLSYPDNTLAFGTISHALLNCYLYMLGNVDSDFSGTASPAISTLLLVLFLLFMMVLMLNLLIALMGQSFSAVSEKGLAQWRLEQASIILDQMFMSDPADLDLAPYVYVLRYTSDLDKSIETLTLDEKVTNKLNQLEGRLDRMSNAVGAKLNSIEAMILNSGDNKALTTSNGSISDSQTSTSASSCNENVEHRMSSLERKFDSLDEKLNLILKKLN